MAIERRLILVTGVPRSGTTAVGGLLGRVRGARVLHEPLNFHVGLREVEQYFEVVGAAGFTAERLDDIVHRLRTLRGLSYKSGVFPEERGMRRALKRVFGGRALNSYRSCRVQPFGDTVIWKDPFAFFLVEHLAGAHDIDVVVTVRNPWAVAGSFKRLGWRFDIADIARRLGAGATWESGVCRPTSGPVDNAACLWAMAHEWLDSVAQTSEQISLLDLETLVRAPLETYRALFARLGLAWSAGVERRVRRMYDSAHEVGRPRPDKVHDKQRDFTKVNTYWRKLLSEAEADRVTRIAGGVWERMADAMGTPEAALRATGR